MTVAELLVALANTFPRAPIQAWKGIYQAVLAPHEGPRLAEAWRLTMADWDSSKMGAPRPADFLKNLPKPEPSGDLGQMPTDEKDERAATLHKRLHDRLWRECYEPWREQANAEGWAHLLMIHLAEMAHRMARTMIDRDMPESDALAHVNARWRPSRGMKWFDEADLADWRERGPR